MLRRRMMMAQGGVSLPAGYTKIEYLESDGNHYIDTGFKPNQDTRVVAEMSYVSHTNETCGLFGGGVKPSIFETYYWSTTYYFSYGSADYSANANVSVGKKMLIDLSATKATYKIGETVIDVTPSAAQTFVSDYTMVIHALHNGSSVSHVSNSRTYSFKIYDNGVLVRDFIPAMNASGEAGLYDLKNDVWYALLLAVKPKVENKISTWNIIRDETPDGYILWQESGLQSEYPVASDITITANVMVYSQGGGILPISGPRNFTILKGNNNTGAVLSGGYYEEVSARFNPFSPITSISPTEDDTYIYTF